MRGVKAAKIAAAVVGCLAVAAAASYLVYWLVRGRDTVAVASGQKRLLAPGDVDCSVTYSATTPCEGDCWTAYQQYQGSITQEPAGNGKPCPPLQISVSCNREMPCLCKGEDLPITAANSLTTCNDCTYLAPGETCYMACADAGMTMMGLPEITCANGTWAFAGLPPSCNPVAATCPPVLGISGTGCANNGIVVQPGSTCVGAVEGDTCQIACSAGFGVPATASYMARCSNGAWVDLVTEKPTTLECAPQAACVAGGADTCAGPVCPSSGATASALGVFFRR